jgi:hypothetical protein
MSNRFECSCFVRSQSQLENAAKNIAVAVDRFLQKFPEAKVIKDASRVLNYSHRRFSKEAAEMGHKFVLLRTIKLDRDVDHD